jgi:hypothetical protein
MTGDEKAKCPMHRAVAREIPRAAGEHTGLRDDAANRRFKPHTTECNVRFVLCHQLFTIGSSSAHGIKAFCVDGDHLGTANPKF